MTAVFEIYKSCNQLLLSEFFMGGKLISVKGWNHHKPNKTTSLKSWLATSSFVLWLPTYKVAVK